MEGKHGDAAHLSFSFLPAYLRVQESVSVLALVVDHVLHFEKYCRYRNHISADANGCFFFDNLPPLQTV